jgi:hypothetical protein
MVLMTVAGQLATAGKENEVGGSIPLFDDVQARIDFAAQGLAVR